MDENNRSVSGEKKKKSTFRPDPLKGFHPDDLIDEIWEDVEKNQNDQEQKSNST